VQHSNYSTASERGTVSYGKKHWITGAGISRLHLIFARVFDERGQELGIGGFLAVRNQANGFRFPKCEPTMGLRGTPEGEIAFEDLEVSASMALRPLGVLWRRTYRAIPAGGLVCRSYPQVARGVGVSLEQLTLGRGTGCRRDRASTPQHGALAVG
jgi:alkylation response protein AidB-like acyl-CoA dehydrogenase